MIHLLFLCFILITSPATTAAGAKTCPEHAAEVVDQAVGKACEMTKEVVGKVKTAVGETLATVRLGDSTIGTLKDSVVKMEEWDLVDSPKRIGEDIKQNASLKVEQGVEQVKETVENVIEMGPTEVVTKTKDTTTDVLRSVVSWCHLLGFTTSYGMGVWVSFVSGCVFKNGLPKHQSAMVLNKMNMVYFRSMAYCVGAALLGFVLSRGRREVLSQKMEIFQGFNLVSALFMILINLIFLEPTATKGTTITKPNYSSPVIKDDSESDLVATSSGIGSTINITSRVFSQNGGNSGERYTSNPIFFIFRLLVLMLIMGESKNPHIICALTQMSKNRNPQMNRCHIHGTEDECDTDITTKISGFFYRKGQNFLDIKDAYSIGSHHYFPDNRSIGALNLLNTQYPIKNQYTIKNQYPLFYGFSPQNLGYYSPPNLFYCPPKMGPSTQLIYPHTIYPNHKTSPNKTRSIALKIRMGPNNTSILLDVLKIKMVNQKIVFFL